MSATHYVTTAPTARLNPKTACGRRAVTVGAMSTPLGTTRDRSYVTCKACREALAKKDAIVAEHAEPLDAIPTDLPDDRL